jgi:hypothetical protein
MKILMISNMDDDEKLEDIWLARVFQKDGHKVAIVDKHYDENLEDLFDIFLLRNTWDTEATIKTVTEKSNFRKRVIKKKLPRINFDGKYDGENKGYLVKLYKEGYSVIPTIDNIQNLYLLKEYDKFILKLKDSYDGIGQMILDEQEVKQRFTNSYVIQPYMKFKSEVQFYYIKDKFEYALEFVPSKVPIYPEAVKYLPSKYEIGLANQFAKLNGDYYGIQRIDFIKQSDGNLLLTEIEDIAPYLDLDCVDEKTKNQFILDYKNMVYDYMENINKNLCKSAKF